MLYEMKSIYQKIVIEDRYEKVKQEMIKFLQGENIYNILGLKKAYINNRDNSIFIEDKDLKDLLLLVKNKYKEDISVDLLEEGKCPIKKIKKDSKEIEFYNINSFEELKKIRKEIHEKILNEERELKKNKPLNKGQLLDKKRKEESLNNKLLLREMFNIEADLKIDINNNKIGSIDFEFKLLKEENSVIIRECGISTLENGVIKTEHYIIKGNNDNLSYTRKQIQNSFHFGETKEITEEELIKILKNKQADYWIFHEKREDNQILKKYNLEIPKNRIRDTQSCYLRHFGINKKRGNNKKKIEELLEGFKIKYKDLHNSGNDSHYTLLLFLKMSQIFELRNSLPKDMNLNKIKY